MAELTWWGHATTVLEVGGVRLLTDPLLRRRVGPLHNPDWVPPDLGRIDAVLVSHRHRDHLDLPSLRRLVGTDQVPVVVPRGAAGLALKAGARTVLELGVGEETRIGGVTVRATRADHPDGRSGRRPGPGTVGYWVEDTTTATTTYFAGDTASFPDMADLAGADLAVLPVGGWGLTHGPGHMDAAEAGRALQLLRPSLAVPVHWGSLRLPALWRLRARDQVTAGEQFRVEAHRAAPAVEVQVLRVGERFVFTP